MQLLLHAQGERGFTCFTHDGILVGGFFLSLKDEHDEVLNIVEENVGSTVVVENDEADTTLTCIDVNHVEHGGGNTRLHVASMTGDVEMVRLLLSEMNIDVNKTNDNGLSALIIASSFGQVEVVRLLSKIDAIDINQTNDQGGTALLAASIQGHAEIVGLLLSNAGIETNTLLGNIERSR